MTDAAQPVRTWRDHSRRRRAVAIGLIVVGVLSLVLLAAATRPAWTILADPYSWLWIGGYEIAIVLNWSRPGWPRPRARALAAMLAPVPCMVAFALLVGLVQAAADTRTWPAGLLAAGVVGMPGGLLLLGPPRRPTRAEARKAAAYTAIVAGVAAAGGVLTLSSGPGLLLVSAPVLVAGIAIALRLREPRTGAA